MDLGVPGCAQTLVWNIPPSRTGRPKEPQGLLKPHSQLWHRRAFLTTNEPWGLFNFLGSFEHGDQRGTLTHQNDDRRVT